MRLKIWLKALRLPFITATIVSVTLGSAIAWYKTGSFNWFLFWLTLLGISLLHLGTNLTNDYFDHKSRNDELNTSPTPFSGGSRVIQDKLISAESILSAAFISFGLGIIIGLYLVWLLKSWLILGLGIVGVLSGFFYTALPFKIGYRGMGEAAIGLCFGPLVVLGSYYVQAQTLSLVSLLASVPVGILILLVVYINEFPDYEADKLANKKTLVVILGKEKAVKIYHILLGLVYLHIFIFVLFKIFPPYTLIIVFTIPLALKAYFVSKANFLEVYELLSANAATIGLHLSLGLLLSVGFILDKLL